MELAWFLVPWANREMAPPTPGLVSGDVVTGVVSAFFANGFSEERPPVPVAHPETPVVTAIRALARTSLREYFNRPDRDLPDTGTLPSNARGLSLRKSVVHSPSH